MINAVNEFLDDLRGGRMAEAPVVTVEQGQLQGRIVNSPSGKAFYSFQGIPYAKPPLGSLRFKAPEPAEPWEGIRDATVEGNVCAQFDPVFAKSYDGDENCLFLNVHTPSIDGAFLPVMIWIHGGAFKWGSGGSNLYGPDFLVEKDVVVVSMNYRCGILGFLSLNTPEVPGNAGIKDIVQAIRWVKDNIHNFGGNAGNITLFGESAGGRAVSLLTASPLTKNLFSKAIIQSGNALAFRAFQQDPLRSARILAKSLGCDSEDVDEILEFLAVTPAKDLVEAEEKINSIQKVLQSSDNLFGFVVEKEFPGVEAVISEAFIDVLTSGRTADVPIMIGATSLEYALENKTDDFQEFIPADLKIERDSEESLAIAAAIRWLYLKDNHADIESLPEYYHLLSDKLINVDTHRYIKYLLQVTNRPIYFYRFDYVGQLNIAKNIYKLLDLNYAMHTDELGYLFKNDFQKDVEPTPEDIQMRERMVRLWTNFAKSGNPVPEESHHLNTTWPPVTKDNIYCLNLASELTVLTNPDKEKMDFWDELYNKHFKIWDHPKTNTIEVPRKEPEVVSVVETVTTSHIVEHQQSHEQEIVTTEEEKVVSEPIEEVTTQITTTTLIETDDGAQTVFVTTETVDTPVDNEVSQNHSILNGVDKKVRTSNEIKMLQNSNGSPKDVIRANDPPEDDLPKNIGVNKFVSFFESLGGKK